jgi:hypothetical protein
MAVAKALDPASSAVQEHLIATATAVVHARFLNHTAPDPQKIVAGADGPSARENCDALIRDLCRSCTAAEAPGMVVPLAQEFAVRFNKPEYVSQVWVYVAMNYGIGRDSLLQRIRCLSAAER